MTSRRVVAVIGIDQYQSWSRLHNAVSDAEGVRDTFKQLGFIEVTKPLLDGAATCEAINDLLDDLDRELSPLDHLVVFFAGHGRTRPRAIGDIETNTGFLIPVDGDPQRTSHWIEVRGFLNRIGKLLPKHILVILDACHAGIALSRFHDWSRGSRPLDEPFAASHALTSRVVIASALSNETARDGGPEDHHSLFTTCLMQALGGGERGVRGVRLADGRCVVNGTDLGYYVRERVQTYPDDLSWRQTPDVGPFDCHQRGEMPIPLLADAHTTEIDLATIEPPKNFAESSAHMRGLLVTRDAKRASKPAARSLALATLSSMGVGLSIAIAAYIYASGPRAHAPEVAIEDASVIYEETTLHARGIAFEPPPPPMRLQPSQGSMAQPDAVTSASELHRQQHWKDAIALHPNGCFAHVNVVPYGADITKDGVVINQTSQHQYLYFPCGGPVTLAFHKAGYVDAKRTITPTLEGPLIGNHLRLAHPAQ